MARSLSVISLVVFLALAGLEPAGASSPDPHFGPSLDELSMPLATPFRLAIRNRTWDGNLHGDPSGLAVLEADRQGIWELAGVTSATASADGSTLALLTNDHQVFVSRLPEAPRRIEGGPYLSPALSSDGTFLVAQRLGEGDHILEKTFNTLGIALINLDSGEDRLLLEGNDLYAPSFASDERIFFGSGGEDRTASLYVLDMTSMNVARATNRVKNARQTFPSETPMLVGGAIVYRADDEHYRVPEPAADDFEPMHRFDAPKLADVEGGFVNFGVVRLRRPSTQLGKNPPVRWYFDLDTSGGVKDWNCKNNAYNGHQGTDFPHDVGHDVVAPASGDLTMRNDGCPDTKQPGCGGGFGNYVGIKHTDGNMSIEAHGRKWTVKGYGSYACAAKVMESASSGNSNAPHIHHESWSATGQRYDPFQGSCDPNDPSKWGQQNGYLSLPGATCTH